MSGVERVRGNRAHQDGVAIRFGAGDTVGADVAAGTLDILDDDLLAEIIGHLLLDDAGDDIGRAAGGKGTTRVTVRSGNFWAMACGAKASSEAAESPRANVMRRVNFVIGTHLPFGGGTSLPTVWSGERMNFAYAVNATLDVRQRNEGCLALHLRTTRADTSSRIGLRRRHEA
jgi:hypothetical protein